VRELLVSRSVVCEPLEAEQPLAWARAHPAWVEDAPPLTIEKPNDHCGHSARAARGDPDR
jgi:hypothetical protein